MLLMIHFFSSKVVALPRLEFHDRHDDMLKIWWYDMNQYNTIFAKINNMYVYLGQDYNSISLNWYNEIVCTYVPKMWQP